MLAWTAPLPLGGQSCALSHPPLCVAQSARAPLVRPSRKLFGGEHQATPPNGTDRTTTVAAMAQTVAPRGAIVERAVVWFRVGDLRARDHPGLADASELTQKSILPLFIFTPNTPPSAVAAVEQLRLDLGARRSGLVVRFADSEVEGLARVLRTELSGVGRVHLRRDVAMQDLALAGEELRTAGPGGGAVELKFWRDELHCVPEDSFRNAPDSYPDFQKWAPRARAAVSRPIPEYEPATVTPGLPGGSLDADAAPLDSGDLGSMEAILEAARAPSSVDAIAARYEEDSARLGACGAAPAVDPEGGQAERVVAELLNSLERYETPDVARVLQPVVWFGLVSPRRIRELVLEHEKLHGRLFPRFFRDGAKTILRYLEARQFADILAERDLAVGSLVNGDLPPKFYRWRGVLVRYVEAGADAPGALERPPLVLIHGFGASCQHMCRSIALISRTTHCYAFCNVGFGRTEKPPFYYTQHLWELFQADFIRDKVQRRCFVAGNSIGGYLAAAFASDSGDDMCDGVALVNTAGTLYSPEEYEERQRLEREQPGYELALEQRNRSLLSSILKHSRPLRFLACNLLLMYLRGNTGRTLANVYPTTPDGWTDELEREIRRNSLDVGAVDVIQSGLILPPQRSLNDLLLADSCPPVFVFQGRLDPLGSTGRAEKLEKVLSGRDLRVEVVQAGHCPHDEIPDKFSESLLDWMETVNNRGSESKKVDVRSLEPTARSQHTS